MEKIIAYVDDADYALHQLAPMMAAPNGQRQRRLWILVACPPRMSRHINKWVNHTARQNWRQKWSDKLFARLCPKLPRGDEVLTLLSNGPLVDMTRQLHSTHGMAPVLDARRPKFGLDLAPVTAEQPTAQESRWSVPGAVAGMGAFLVLAGE